MIAHSRSAKKASVRALGCRLNQYEVSAIADLLEHAGYEVVPFGEPADLGVINTCTVTNEADAKSRNAIRRFIRANPNKPSLYVTFEDAELFPELAVFENTKLKIRRLDNYIQIRV